MNIFIIPFSFLFLFLFSSLFIFLYPFFPFLFSFFFPLLSSLSSPSLAKATRGRPGRSATSLLRTRRRPPLSHVLVVGILHPSQQCVAPPSLHHRHSSRRPFFLTAPPASPAPAPLVPRTPLPCADAAGVSCSSSGRPSSVRRRPPPVSSAPKPPSVPTSLFLKGANRALKPRVSRQSGGLVFSALCCRKRSREQDSQLLLRGSCFREAFGSASCSSHGAELLEAVPNGP